jgi:hypothetical protein
MLLAHRSLRRASRAAFVVAVFTSGWLVGSLSTQPADAQLGDLGKQAMEKAGEGGGAMGAAAKLGTNITEMQEHVSALQKNIDALNAIKASLGG